MDTIEDSLEQYNHQKEENIKKIQDLQNKQKKGSTSFLKIFKAKQELEDINTKNAMEYVIFSI